MDWEFCKRSELAFMYWSLAVSVSEVDRGKGINHVGKTSSSGTDFDNWT